MDESRKLPAGLSYPWGETIPAPDQAVEIAPRILWLRLPLPMKLDHVNIYALDDGDGWTVIDTGFGGEAPKAQWEALLAGPLAAKPVTRVIATHHHPDHIGLAGWFQAEKGAALWTTRTAWLFARMLTLDHHDAPSEASIRHMIRGGAPERLIEAARSREPWTFSRVVAPLPLGYKRIKAGDVVRMGGRRWRVATGAGHAPEHATFWSLDDEFVISGDQILPRISPNLGVYATEPEADPVGEWMESCRALQPLAREGHLVLPGHNRPFHGLPKRLEQQIQNHVGALARLRRHLDQPRTATECFDVIFKREIADGEFGLAMNESLAHLNHLWLAGEAERAPGGDGAYRFRLKGLAAA